MGWWPDSRCCNRRGMPPAGTKTRNAAWLPCGPWSLYSDFVATPAADSMPNQNARQARSHEATRYPVGLAAFERSGHSLIESA